MADKRITYPLFKAFTSSGAFASGYKLYTYEAGTTTPSDSYSDAGLTTLNTNPIILNSLGECNLYLNQATKLTLTDAADNVQTGWPLDDIDPTTYAASDISYDPSDTGFTSTNVQDVVDEIYVDLLDDLEERRNRVYNSEMMVDLENVSTAVTTTGSYPVEGFKVSWADTDNLTISAQQTGALGGYRSSVTVTATANETDWVDTSEYVIPFEHRFLGYNVADFVNGVTVTIQFYFKSNQPNNSVFSVALVAGDSGYSYVTDFTYTTTATAQLVTKTIIIPAHASNYISNKTTGVGLKLYIAAFSGTDFQGTADTWNAAHDMCSNNASLTDWTQPVDGPTDGYVQITGVSLRVGSVALPLEMKSIDEYLDECLPYYTKSYSYPVVPGTATSYEFEQRFMNQSAGNITTLNGNHLFPQKMVGVPGVTVYSVDTGDSGKVYDIIGTADIVAGANMADIGDRGFSLVSLSANLATGRTALYHYAADARI